MNFTLDSTLKGPLYRRVYESLRGAIVKGEFKLHQQLPASRELALQLSLSRNTVNTAYDMLRAEGYVGAKQGSGYFVCAELPNSMIRFERKSSSQEIKPIPLPLSKRGRVLARPTRPVPKTTNAAFQPGLPDLEQFPFAQWQRCMTHTLKTADRQLYKYSDEGGYGPLKDALQQYLSLARSVDCTSEQIVIVNGSQAGLDLITRLLTDNGDTIAMEEPGYLGARDAFLAAGAKIEPISVDEDGLVVSDLSKRRKNIRLVYTTPSYQFPLGVTLSLSRRLALLQWAKDHQALIIEDDYDSEFRFHGRPLSCLQGLDKSQRVIYFGTFSKVMFPGLRLGYIVVPPTLVDGFAKSLRKTGQDAPLQMQAAMTEFINQGLFSNHIRRMRHLYGEKQEHFIELVRLHLGDHLDIQKTSAGMQVPAFYRQGINQDKLLQLARQADLIVAPLSNYYLKEVTQPGLYLGYAGVPLSLMKKNVLILKTLFETMH